MPLLQPRWVVNAQYTNIPLKPLPFPSIPHCLGYRPPYLNRHVLVMEESIEESMVPVPRLKELQKQRWRK